MTAVGSGASVGQYVLGRELGKGGMATVYEATHVALGKRVALKTMHPHLAQDKTASSRFLREGKAAAQIHNPHVVDVFDVGMHDGVPYLVMELLDGIDLAAVLRDRGKLPLRELVDAMLPVASAVHAAHGVGVIHRDLKPSNIVLARRADGTSSPTILDFGISKVAGDVLERDLTASEVLLGTVHYMSPEQTRGGRNASALSDQYALGVILYECATGTKPFSGNSPYSLMHAIVSSKVLPPSALEPRLPPEFDEVVLRAMHRDPGKRFASVRELGARLLPWASDDTRRRWAPELGVDADAPAPAASGRRKNRLLRIAALLLVLGGGAIAARAIAGASATPAATPPPVAAHAFAPASPLASGPPVDRTEAPGATEIVPPPAASSVAAQPSHRPRGATSASAAGSAAKASPSALPERGTNGALIVE